MRQFVYHEGLPRLIGKIAHFLGKEACLEAESISLQSQEAVTPSLSP